MDQAESNIVNHERIVRILQKICEANLGIFLRCQSHPTISIKGKLDQFDFIELENRGKLKVLKISGLSPKAIRFLEGQEVIQVEFLLKATKVIFVSKILRRSKEFLDISIPKKLTSLERRGNERYSTNENIMAYLNFNIDEVPQIEYTGFPVFPNYSHLRGYAALSDLSLGGVCVSTYFPRLTHTLFQGATYSDRQLILPLRKPLPVQVEVRWIKKIKENIKDKNGRDNNVTLYKFGCEFKNINDELENEIRNFIRLVSQSEAI